MNINETENVHNVQSVPLDEDFYLLPNSVYENLPDLLKPYFNSDLKYVNDIALLSLITSLSACMPNVFGYYNQEKQYTNFYTFIVSPPANNKRMVEIGLPIVMSIHKRLYNESSLLRKLYKKEEKSQDKPPLKIKYLPASTTSSKLVRHLFDNEMSLIIADTEADTLTNQLKSPHGNFSDLLRKIFGNETISKSTLIDDRFEIVENPKLSILLSGTPNQVVSLINSTEDGLFSRFCFLNHNKYEKWKAAEHNTHSLNKEYLDELTDKITDLYFKLTELDNAIEVNFSENQTTHLNLEISKIHDCYLIDRPDTIATIRRMAMIHCRICLILTVLSNMETIREMDSFLETNGIKINLDCTNLNFQLALDIIKVLINHAISVIDLKKPKKKFSSQLKKN